MRRILLAPLIAVYGLLYGIGYVPVLAFLILFVVVVSLGFLIGGFYVMIVIPVQFAGYLVDSAQGDDLWPWFIAVPAWFMVAVVGFFAGATVVIGASKAALVGLQAIGELRDADILQGTEDFEGPRDMWRNMTRPSTPTREREPEFGRVPPTPTQPIGTEQSPQETSEDVQRRIAEIDPMTYLSDTRTRAREHFVEQLPLSMSASEMYGAWIEHASNLQLGGALAGRVRDAQSEMDSIAAQRERHLDSL